MHRGGSAYLWCGLCCKGIVTDQEIQITVFIPCSSPLLCLNSKSLWFMQITLKHCGWINTTQGNIKGLNQHTQRNKSLTKDSGFRGTSNILGLEASSRKTTKRADPIWSRDIPWYMRAWAAHFPYLRPPPLLCLKPHCDCIDPLPACAPRAAVVVEITASSYVCPTGAGRDWGIGTSCRNSTSWEHRSRRPPRWPFSYMWEIQLWS